MFLVSSVAFAAEDHTWYAVATAGPSSLHDVCSAGEALVSLASCDDESVGYQVLVGRTFVKGFAAEVGYINAGEAIAYAVPAVGGTMKVQPQMATATAVYKLSFGDRFGLFVKGGIVYYDTQIDYSDGVAIAKGLIAKQEKGVEQTIGGGVEMRAWRNLSLRLEYGRFNDVGVGDIEMATAGVRVDF